MTKEKHIDLNILIIASSDMDGSQDNHNIPDIVINAKLLLMQNYHVPNL